MFGRSHSGGLERDGDMGKHGLFTFVLVAALAASSNAQAPSAKPLIAVNIATYGTGIGPWCVSVAQEEGFFTDAGIRIANWITTIGDPNIVSALMSGQAVIADGGAASLLPVANGQTDQLVLIAGAEHSPAALITSTAITSPAQLAATTIALPAHNTSNEVIASALIDQVVGKGKWTPLYIGGASTARVAAMAAGKASAAYVNEPVDIGALGPGFHRLTRFDVKQRYPNGGLISTRDWLRQNPETAIRFLGAYARGCDFILDLKNRAAAVDILARRQPVPHDVAAEAYQYYVAGPDRGLTPPTDARLDVQGIAAEFVLLKEAGIVTNPNFDYRTIVDLSYLDKALRSPYFKR